MRPSQIEYLYCMMSLLEFGVAIAYYSWGFYALYRKSIRLLDTFNLLCLLGLLSQMLQAYVQK